MRLSSWSYVLWVVKFGLGKGSSRLLNFLSIWFFGPLQNPASDRTTACISVSSLSRQLLRFLLLDSHSSDLCSATGDSDNLTWCWVSEVDFRQSHKSCSYSPLTEDILLEAVNKPSLTFFFPKINPLQYKTSNHSISKSHSIFTPHALPRPSPHLSSYLLNLWIVGPISSPFSTVSLVFSSISHLS